MINLVLLDKVKKRKEQLGISLNDIANLSSVAKEKVYNFFSAKNIEDESIENITKILGLDNLGNEIIDIQTLKEKRAEERALYIVSLVQDTASLEMQGLDKEDINNLLQKTKEQFLTGEYKEALWKTIMP